jgi:hypothetical protein
MTGMPASMACRATWLSCWPSLGSRTSTPTFCWTSDSTAEICWLMSLVGSTGLKVTSEYCLAAAAAFFAMAAIQPWSAAGAENPIVTGVPGWSLPPVAAGWAAAVVAAAC